MKSWLALFIGLFIGLSATSAAAPQITNKVILWQKDQAKLNATSTYFGLKSSLQSD